MNNREVSVAVCGVVVGVMVAAATVTSLGGAFSIGSDLSGAVVSPVTRDPALVRKAISLRTGPVSRRPAQRVRTSETVGGTIGTTATDMAQPTGCDAVTGAMANLAGSFDSMRPVNPDALDAAKNGRIRTLLQTEMDRLVSDACNGNASAAVAGYAGSNRKTNNRCWQYSASPTRYPACKAAEDAGNPYP